MGGTALPAPRRARVRPGSVWWAPAVLLAVVCTVLLSVAPARAHAVLLEVRPADGASIASAPERVTMRFDEPVSTPTGGVRVFDSEGDRVDAGTAGQVAGDPTEVSAELGEGLGDGTYVVTWRVVSLDGHPLRGAWLFTVGDTEADQSLLAELFAADDERLAAVAAVSVRWLLYGAALFAGGAALVTSRVGPDLGDRRVHLLRWIRAAVVAAAALTLLGIVAQAARVTGLGVMVVTAHDALVDTLVSGYGASALVRLVGLVALWRWLTSGASVPAPSAPVVGGALLTVVSFAVEGHTVTTAPVWLAFSAGAVHAVAAAVWGAGLVVLAVGIGRGGVQLDPARTARLVAGFSALATATVAALVVTGGALAWLEVRVPRALTSTSYGWALVAKLVLLLPVLAAGAYNRRRLVPAVVGSTGPRVPAGGSGDAALSAPHPRARGEAPSRDGAVSRLRRTLGAEVVGIVAVLAATSVLVGLQPAADAAGVTGAYSTYVPLGDDYELNLTVDPNRVGHNQLHLYVLGPDGREVDVADDVTLSLSQPARDLGPLARETTRLGPGHFLLSGPELSVPGEWQVTAEVPVSRFEVLEATVPVTVNP